MQWLHCFKNNKYFLWFWVLGFKFWVLSVVNISPQNSDCMPMASSYATYLNT